MHNYCSISLKAPLKPAEAGEVLGNSHGDLFRKLLQSLLHFVIRLSVDIQVLGRRVLHHVIHIWIRYLSVSQDGLEVELNLAAMGSDALLIDVDLDQ